MCVKSRQAICPGGILTSRNRTIYHTARHLATHPPATTASRTPRRHDHVLHCLHHWDLPNRSPPWLVWTHSLRSWPAAVRCPCHVSPGRDRALRRRPAPHCRWDARARDVLMHRGPEHSGFGHQHARARSRGLSDVRSRPRGLRPDSNSGPAPGSTPFRREKSWRGPAAGLDRPRPASPRDPNLTRRAARRVCAPRTKDYVARKTT